MKKDKIYSKIKISFSCKGKCLPYKVKPTRGKNFGPYAQGYKWCGECNLFIKYDKVHCVCCGRKLRTRPECRRFKNLDERLYIE